MISVPTESFVQSTVAEYDKVSINIKLGNEVINIPQKTSDIHNYFSELNNEDGLMKLERCGYHDSVFIKILDNVPSTFNLSQLIYSLNKGYDYFDKMEISLKIKNRLNVWVKNLGKYSYTWTELLDKPNYALEVFQTRFWPFFNVENKDWKHISANTLRGDTYPNQQDCVISDSKNNMDSTKKNPTEILHDYKIEYNLSQKYNNFLGYSVMNPDDYPNMQNIIMRLQTIKKVDLKLLMFEAILRLLITPTTCHIIKQEGLWELVNPLFSDKQFGNVYKKIFFHFMYYAMFILDHEDTVMFSQIKRNYRIIFTHMEALCMPQTYKMHIEMDPFIQQLTDETYLAQTMPYYLRCKRYVQPIDVFERRFYLATGGSLANIPLHKFNAAVSGSILIPCLVYCELENDFKNIRYETKRTISNQLPFNDDLYRFVDKLTPEEKDFVSYLEYYYPSYHSLTDNEYVEQVLTQSIEIENVEDKKEEKEYKLRYNILSDIDISVTCDNYETFNELAVLLANQIKLNCESIGEVWIKKVYTAATFKYKIYGPGLMRPIDLFRVPYGPEKMVKKFHCPIVRSWYDGSNKVGDDIFEHNKKIDEFWNKKNSAIATDSYDIAYGENEYVDVATNTTETPNVHPYYIGVNIIRSCLAAILSGVNNSYKWFFNSKPCVEVILKYAQRGFTTIINKKEMTAMIEYMKISPRWKQFVSNDIDIMGMMTQNHVFFHPSLLDAGIRHKLRKFRKAHIDVYNKKQHVGLPKTETEYDVNLRVKDNTKVYQPDINKINLFVNYMEQLDQEEFSDGDEF